MAANTEQLHKRARALEEQLIQLDKANAPGAQQAVVLQEYRAACEDAIFAGFEYAAAQAVEQHLWKAHLQVNGMYRKETRSLKRSKERVVELRKLQKSYLQFIKTSQRFYRQYILNLDAQFDGIPELRQIARKWKDDPSRAPVRRRIPVALKTQVLQSCHQALIQLGDLSRYRETELGDEKDRNWGPAKGYYELAADIHPDSGHSHNQMAVIAREDKNHFSAVYHIYRSLASKQPYPQAKANLEVEFKRVLAAWDRGELINSQKSPDGNIAGRALIAWFVRLHSKCYKGEDFKEHDELESEVLSHLAIELKERPLDSILQRIILINLAAEYFATMQMQSANSPPNIIRTYFYFLRLNVKTFFTLLQVLQPELERLSEGDDVTLQNGDRTPQLSDKITAVARRILPALRLYSTWFSRYWHVLDAGLADTLTAVEIQELWKSYAETLTLLVSSFPVDQLPQDSYMLEEDTATIGFQPLVDPKGMRLWYDGATIKQKWTDLERNHPNIEMLMRVKDLLVDGLLLTQDPDAPLDLDGKRFIYREAGLPSLASPHNRAGDTPPISAEPMDFPLFPQEAPIPDDQKSYSVAAASESASTVLAKDSAMNRMVDDLVGPDDGLDPLPEEDENIPPTPPEQTFEDTAMVSDSGYGLASFSISDIVNTVQNYKKPVAGSPAPAAALFSTPMARGTSSSSIRGPAHLPSLPDGQWNSNSIWNRNYNGTPGPSSPLLPNSADLRNSPMTPLNGMHSAGLSGHMRGDSSNSLRSSEYTVGAPVQPARPVSGGLGNGAAWGNPTTQPAASYWSSVYGNSYNHNQAGSNTDLNLVSPALWPSSYAQKEHSSYGRTPPNGQAG